MDRYILPRTRRTCIAALVAGALAAVGGAGLPGCEQGQQGDRCNPNLIENSSASSINGGAYNEDECNSGLTCTVPPTCVIAVCCPAKPPYSDPNCACLANPGSLCACTVNELDGAPWVSEDSGSNDAETVDSASVDSGTVDATTPIDAPIDAPTDGAG